ncbi:MAG: hypothetical protein HXY46_06880 [Syntrophaceae bacterium]|nr:hypothetical protein [Syntrophaceae bacterium]
MRRLLFLILVMAMAINGGLAIATDQQGAKREMKRLLPVEMEGYKSDGKDQLYDRQTTFRYMDGAAELYRSYGFKLLMVRRYIKADHPSIVVELFDMGSSEDAFGIFSYETGEEEVGVGQGSDYGGGLLRFWKGNYFVNVFAERETASTKKDILGIGHAIAKNIKKEGKKPELLQFLPGEGLSERSLRYFHLHPVLNHHYFISHQNILHLGEETNGVLATYLLRQKKEKTFLLLVRYPAKGLAEDAFHSFLKAYMPEASLSRTIKTENGKWTSAQILEQYILVVFDAPSQEKAKALIEATRNNLRRRPL